MVSCESSAGEPSAKAISPAVSTVTPCFSASGSSVSAAVSASSERSTGSPGERALVGPAEHEQRLGEIDGP
jgi:hypothetical protein